MAVNKIYVLVEQITFYYNILYNFIPVLNGRENNFGNMLANTLKFTGTNKITPKMRI